MAINDEIITSEKLLQYDRVSHLETWEQSKRFVDTSILGEMDWYLIDGIITDYLFVEGKEAKKFEKVLIEVCDNEKTIEFLKELADDFELNDDSQDEISTANDEIITARKISFFKATMHLEWDHVKDINPNMFGVSDWNMLMHLTNEYFKATKTEKSKRDKNILDRELKELCDNSLTVEIFKEMVSELEPNDE